MFLRRLFRQKCQVTMTLYTLLLVGFHSRWMKCWFYSWKRKWLSCQYLMLNSQSVVFWHVCFAYWVTISICSMYIVLTLFWRKILKIKMWYDSQQGLIHPESLWHLEIFSWNLVFSRAVVLVIHFSFLKTPTWLWLCHRTAQLWPQAVWTPKLIFNGHSWSVELWWNVNRHISVCIAIT